MKPFKSSQAPEFTTEEEFLDAFHEYGWDRPGLQWNFVVEKLGPFYGLTTKNGMPNNRAASMLLKRCKLAYNRGSRAAKKNQPAITRIARQLARERA
jgi:hypothetical protein